MRIPVTLTFALFAGPAFALNQCDEWWFTRNLVFDRAGYCFSSALGEAVFDNADCTTDAAKLDAASQQLVDTILALEASFECKVDTTRTTLQVDQVAARMRLVDPPIADEYESACFGWLGASFPLYSGRDTGSPVSGMIDPGEDILMMFTGAEGWAFLYSSADDPDMGWTRDFVWRDDNCTANAG